MPAEAVHLSALADSLPAFALAETPGSATEAIRDAVAPEGPIDGPLPDQ